MIAALFCQKFYAPLLDKGQGLDSYSNSNAKPPSFLRKLANESLLAIRTTHRVLPAAGLRPMKEAIIYSISGCSSLLILAYTVHMFIGGMVSEQTEYMVMAIVVLIAASVMLWMLMDVLRRRRHASNNHQGR